METTVRTASVTGQDNHRESSGTVIMSTVVLGAFLAAVYYWLSMRKQKPTTLFSTKIGTAKFDIIHFGSLYFWSNVGLDLILGFGSAFVMVTAVKRILNQRRASSSALGSAGPLVLAVATFGCPSCAIPLAGTLGVGAFGTALPLLGTEFKLVALVAVALSFYMLRRQRVAA